MRHIDTHVDGSQVLRVHRFAQDRLLVRTGAQEENAGCRAIMSTHRKIGHTTSGSPPRKIHSVALGWTHQRPGHTRRLPLPERHFPDCNPRLRVGGIPNEVVVVAADVPGRPADAGVVGGPGRGWAEGEQLCGRMRHYWTLLHTSQNILLSSPLNAAHPTATGSTPQTTSRVSDGQGRSQITWTGGRATGCRMEEDSPGIEEEEEEEGGQQSPVTVPWQGEAQ